MIKIGDKEFRNIQEQVEKNKNDIAGWTTLDAFGIKVLGIVATDADIPAGTYEYGDAYLVGTEEPYDLYVYTRGTEGFVNIGPLTVVGPAGPKGDKGDAGTIAIGTVTTGDPGSQAAVMNSGTASSAVLNFIIPRGATGATGPQGEQGPIGLTGQTGATGATGPQGDPGESFMIIGTISNVSQLPDPSETPRNYAYVYDDGDSSTPNRLYYITGTAGNEVWSYSPLAAAGTTVSVSGSPVSTWNADTKLDKNTAPTTYIQAYSKNEDGTQTLLNVDGGIVNGAIVQRSSTGYIYVPDTPTQSNHAASKQYVDLKQAQLYLHNIYIVSDDWRAAVKIINRDNSSINTLNQLATWLNTNGFTVDAGLNGVPYQATGSNRVSQECIYGITAALGGIAFFYMSTNQGSNYTGTAITAAYVADIVVAL